MLLQIENTSICNAKCVFCPHSIMEREKETMSHSVYAGILADCVKYPIDGIILTGIGEPLLDKNIISRVEEAKRVAPVTIYTNGTNLKKYLPDLLKVGLDSLVISLNAVTSEKRMQIMRLDGLDELNSIILNWNEKCQLTICAIPDMGIMERFDVDAMIEKYKGNYTVYPHYASNWGGQYNFCLQFKPRNICPRPFEIFHVISDGTYVLCCLDYEGLVRFGKSIGEVISNDQWKYYREMLKTGKRSELELCGNCSTV